MTATEAAIATRLITEPESQRRVIEAALLMACFAWSPGRALAQPTIPPNAVIEELRQQEREKALRGQNERAVDERLQGKAPVESSRIPPSETPCFRIDRITLVGDHADTFQWVIANLDDLAERSTPGLGKGNADGSRGDPDSPLGRCLGTEGVNVVLSRAQARLIAAGWVTSRILAAPQDLASGILTLTLVPGRIAQVRLSADSVVPAGLAGTRALLASAIPAAAGELLNLHDIEQGLENLKRVPTADADIQIEPASGADARPGDSDLVVRYRQKLPLRAALSLDDGGTKSTGKYQSGLTVSADNLLGLNELFYVSANHSINNHLFAEPSHGTEGQTGHFSMPWGYWLLSVTASNSRYWQTVAGASQSYRYAGGSATQELKLSRLVYRDQRRKTTLSLKGFHRASRNFIEDTEVAPQHRSVGGWEASLNHKEFIDAATLEATLNYKRGTGAFGAIPAPEEAFGEGTSRLRLVGAEVNFNVPFNFEIAGKAQHLRYAALARGQWNRTRLTPQDQFSIGGRYSVRGFDGETSLLGDRGFLLRNDVGWTLEAIAAEAYAGLDYGQVGGPAAAAMLGKRLLGVVVGLRGNWRQLSYDLFVGTPVAKPDGYRTARLTGGLSLNLGF